MTPIHCTIDPAGCTDPDARSELRRGIAAMAPLVAGFLPLGLALGAAVGRHSDPLAAWAGTFLVYGASAHFAVLELLDAGAGLAAVVVTGLLVNARLLLYGASMARLWGGEPLRFQGVAAAMLVDPSWAVARARDGEPGTAAARRAFYLGAAGTLFVAWAVIVTVGALLGPSLPAALDLEAIVPICFAALVVPRLTDRAATVAALVAVAGAAASRPLPAGADLVIAAALGTAVALAHERRAARAAAAPGTAPATEEETR
jgi:predicted branched-subunit amino acid permease